MSKSRKCIICGTLYEYCPHCNGADISSMWKTEYCSEDCRQIFKVCARYAGDSISKKDAYELLKSYDIDSKVVQESVKKTVDEIMLYKPETKKEDPLIETVNLSEEPVDTVNSVEEEMVIKHRSRRRRMKKTDDE